MNSTMHHLTENKHESALIQRDLLRKCLLTSLGHRENKVKMTINNPTLLFLWCGNLHHVRNETGGFQLEKGVNWHLWCGYCDYLLSLYTEVVIL